MKIFFRISVIILTGSVLAQSFRLKRQLTTCPLPEIVTTCWPPCEGDCVNPLPNCFTSSCNAHSPYCECPSGNGLVRGPDGNCILTAWCPSPINTTILPATMVISGSSTTAPPPSSSGTTAMTLSTILATTTVAH